MTLHYLDDLAPGQRFTGATRARVDEEAIKAFAREFDPQPFHLDNEAARDSLFGSLAASGWHTAALTMRLLVDSEPKLAGGIIGAGFDELRWPLPCGPATSCGSNSRCWRCGRPGASLPRAWSSCAPPP